MMKIKNRDHARELIAAAGVTVDNVTRSQLKSLWKQVNFFMWCSMNYRGSYVMDKPDSTKFMTCSTDQWNGREAISFNRDGFIGMAGWADQSNVDPILRAVGTWLDNMDRRKNKAEYHTHCNDCGQFLATEWWIRKDHSSYQHALCRDCASNYDSPYDY